MIDDLATMADNIALKQAMRELAELYVASSTRPNPTGDVKLILESHDVSLAERP